jgi:hypothetical protein
LYLEANLKRVGCSEVLLVKAPMIHLLRWGAGMMPATSLKTLMFYLVSHK